MIDLNEIEISVIRQVINGAGFAGEIKLPNLSRAMKYRVIQSLVRKGWIEIEPVVRVKDNRVAKALFVSDKGFLVNRFEKELDDLYKLKKARK